MRHADPERFDQKIAWLRQLLAWRSEIAGDAATRRGGRTSSATRRADDRVYVLTPEARVIELPLGSTPIDFAYHVHSELGHRCRGARVDGAIVSLNTPLVTGQTVEIITAKPSPTTSLEELGPSRDWLNPQLGYLHSHAGARKGAAVVQRTRARGDAGGRARAGREGAAQTARVGGRAMPGFDAVAREARLRAGRRAVRRGREGRDRAAPGRRGDHAGSADSADPDARRGRAAAHARAARRAARRSGVLVVGVDALMTQLAKCCKPAPPDPIAGFVTRGTRRVHPSHRLHEPRRDARARARADDRRSSWGDAGAQRRGLSGRRAGHGAGPPGTAARHLRGASRARRSTSSACRPRAARGWRGWLSRPRSATHGSCRRR